MRRQEVITGLRYIVESPLQKNGGFHPEVVRVAKAALKIIEAQVASTNKQSTPFNCTCALKDGCRFRDNERCGFVRS